MLWSNVRKHLATKGAETAVGSNGDVVPVGELRAAQARIKENAPCSATTGEACQKSQSSVALRVRPQFVLKPMIDSIVFDLDGTLWDSSASCAVGWNRVLDRHRIPFRPITDHDVRAVNGKPHEECIREVFAGLSEADILTLAAETQFEDNMVVAEFGGDLFGGVVAGLGRLSGRYPLFIVSNCQAGYIEVFFRWSQLGSCFRDFECWGNTGLSKTQNLRVVIDRNRLRHPVFVGDTAGDQAAARECGVPFLHAAYGFGECSGVDHRFVSFTALTEWLLNQQPPVSRE